VVFIDAFARFINNKYGPNGEKYLIVSTDKPIPIQNNQPTPLGSSPPTFIIIRALCWKKKKL